MQNKKRNILIVAGVIAIIFFIIIFNYFYSNSFWAVRNNPFKSSKLNILLVGYDSTINGPPRADTIIVGSIDLKTNEVGLLSIPRDTRVDIPGHGYNRINASHAYGGIELTVSTLEEYLDVPIDYYVETDFQGFAGLVDAIGGVDIDIQEPLHYVDNAGGLYIDLPAGRQSLDGEEALQYVRYREPIKADIGRVERQQKFIKALMKKIVNPDIILKLPNIYQEIRKTINTNIPIQDATPFVKFLKGINLNRVDTVMLPGEPKYMHGASYWISDQKELDIVINKLIKSKEYIRNGEYGLEILNGNGISGQASTVSKEMKKYGFEIISHGNADSFDYEYTQIIYFDREDKDIAMSINEIMDGELKYINKEESEDDRDEDIRIIIGIDNLVE
ncbi:MAG: LCP family protein [Halanaerobiaceae bacterium]